MGGGTWDFALRWRQRRVGLHGGPRGVVVAGWLIASLSLSHGPVFGKLVGLDLNLVSVFCLGQAPVRLVLNFSVIAYKKVIERKNQY